MARPRKTSLDYFPLDTDFFQDEKMICIYGEFGIKGQVIALHLLCAVYRNGYFARWDERLSLKIAAATGLSTALVDQVVRALARWKFFDKTALEQESVLTSPGIQRRYFEAVRWRATDGDLPYILVSQRKTYVSQKETPVSQQKTAKNKIKEKKISPDGDTTKPTTSPPPESKISFEKIMQILRNDRLWVGTCCARYNLSEPALQQWLGKFEAHCIMYDKIPGDISDAKRHFCSWHQIASKNKDNENRQINQPSPAGSRSKRTAASPNCGLIEDDPV